MPKLVITLLRCINLIKADLFGKSDPFVEFRVGTFLERSTIIKKNLNPIWKDEKFQFYLKTLKENIEITVYDWDDNKEDDLLGVCSYGLKSLRYEKPQTIRIQLQNSKSQGQIEIEVLLTRKSCIHRPSGIVEINGGCCNFFHGCEICHDQDKRIKNHQFQIVKKVRCLNCTMEQPFRRSCISCDMLFAPSSCFKCKKYFKEKGVVHCYSCEKCILNPKGHSCFLFISTKSKGVQLLEELKRDYVEKDDYQDFWKKVPRLRKSVSWIFICFEKRLPKTIILQCREVLNITEKIEDKIVEEYWEKISLFSTRVLYISKFFKDELSKNVNLQKREFYLLKRRILRKVNILGNMKMKITKHLVPDSQFHFKKEKKEKDDGKKDEPLEENNDEKVSRWKVEDLRRDETLSTFLDKVDKIDSIDDFLHKDLLKTFEKMVKEKETDLDVYFTRKEVVLFYNVLANLIRVIYSDVEMMKNLGNHKYSKKEGNIITTYQKLGGFDNLEVHMVILRVLFHNFNSDTLYLHYLDKQIHEVERTATKLLKKQYVHVMGLKELKSFFIRSVEKQFIQILEGNFYNLEKVFICFNLFKSLFDEVVQGQTLDVPKFILMFIKKANIFNFISKRAEEKTEKEIGDDDSPESDTVQKFFRSFYSLERALDYFKAVESRGISKKFVEYFEIDLMKELSNKMSKDLQEVVVRSSKISEKDADEIPIEILRKILPTIFDLGKYLDFSQLNVYDLYHWIIKNSLNNNLKSKLDAWVVKAINLEKYEPIEPPKKLHSEYCQHVIQLVFGPIELIFELDCLSRETKGCQRSVILEYFDIMTTVLETYIKSLHKKIDDELDNSYHFKATNSGFVNFIQKLKDDLEEDLLAKKKKTESIDLHKICMLANNIQGCLKLTTDLFLDGEFEELIVSSGVEFGDDDDELEIQYILDIPEIKRCVDILSMVRDDTSKTLAEFIYLEHYAKMNKILKSKDGTNTVLTLELVDKMNERFGYLTENMYYRIFFTSLKALYVLIVNETLEFVFQKEKNYEYKSNAVYLIEAMKNLFWAEGEGVQIGYLNQHHKNFIKYVSLLDKSVDDLESLYEEKKGSRISFYILKILGNKGNRKQKKMAQSILPDEKPQLLVELMKQSLDSSDSMKLFVDLIRCQNLAAKDKKSETSDPYVKFRLGKQKKKSKTHKKTLNPVFNEEFIFNVQKISDQKLQIEVLDWNLIGSSDHIGLIDISFPDLPFGKKITKILTLKDKKTKIESGTIEIHLKLASIATRN